MDAWMMMSNSTRQYQEDLSSSSHSPCGHVSMATEAPEDQLFAG